MRPPDTPRYRGMHIFAGIRIAMVHAMMRCPPENAHLRAGLGEKGEDKLRDSTELEGAMAEVTVIAGSDRKHANAISDHEPRDIRPFERCP